MKYDYGDKSRGLSFEHRNFYHSLKSYCKIHDWEFFHYDFVERGNILGIDLMTEELLEISKKENPNYLFAVLFDFNKDPRHEVFKRISELGVKTIHWFCDDHWRFEKYSSIVAPNFDFVCTTANSALPKYKNIGLFERVIKTQWGCNNELYIPYDINKDINISFVGQPHGNRREVVSQIENKGLDIKVFGFNWNKNSRIPFHQMIRLFSRSKINLNLSNSFSSDGQQIKGRIFEIQGTKSFLMTNNAENLEDYYINGEDIILFESINELIEKAQYYLTHENERLRIAENAFKKTLKEHTWHHRYFSIFNKINSRSHAEKLYVSYEKSDLVNEPFISIIIPAYNQEKYITETIESIIIQNYTNWECIIVNDGSTDSTGEKVQSFLSKYPDKKFQLIEKKNGGLADARNNGIEIAAGEWIFPLDSDDKIAPDFLEKVVSVIKRNSSVNLVYTNVQHFDNSNGEWIPPDYDPTKIIYYNMMPYASVYKKTLWMKSLGYYKGIPWGAEDWNFWIECSKNNLNVIRIPEKLFYYRIHKNGSMYDKMMQHWDEVKACIYTLHNELVDHNQLLQTHEIISKMHFDTIKLLDNILIKYPELSQPYFWRALVCENNFEYEKASILYKKAISLNNRKDWQHFYHLGLLNMKILNSTKNNFNVNNDNNIISILSETKEYLTLSKELLMR